MNKIKTIIACFFYTVLALASPQNTEGIATDSNYVKEIEAWHQRRIEGLKAENGWLNLVGLFWLEEGINTFGSDKSNKIIFPKGVRFMGDLILKNGEITIETKADAQVRTVKDEAITTLKLFPSDKDIVLKSGSLRWFIIKRGDKYGIRLRDLESETVLNFKDISTYPISQDWRIKARFEAADLNKKIPITDVLGQTNLQSSPGTLVFTVGAKEYRLDAIEGGKQLFIIFKDATSGNTTYGAGRFLYTDKPDNEGYVYIDFNKSINPPCAFTAFATCPLPPEQNILPIGIIAGEKKYSNH